MMKTRFQKHREEITSQWSIDKPLDFSDEEKKVKKLANKVASSTVDVITLGQKDTVDAYTGGLASSLQGTLNFNSKDAIRLGATVGAFGAGGPMGGVTANQFFGAQGVSPQSVLNYVGRSLGIGDIVPNEVTGANPLNGNVFESGYQSSTSGYGGAPAKFNIVPWLILAVIVIILFFVFKSKKG